MIDIQFPKPAFKIEARDRKQYIFDAIRKQWLVLTPEEWVRQNFLQYLVLVKQYPAAWIAVEREIALGELKKRFDIVVYKEAKPWMIIECKEMQVPLSEAVLQQILNYNISLMVSYLVITNGRQTFAVSLKYGKAEWLHELPGY